MPAASSDREEFCRVRRESSAFHRPWEPSPAPGLDPYGPEAFARYLEGSERVDLKRLLVCAREDGRIVGSINLSQIFRGAFQNAYLGYWIGAEYAGKGYMREAVRLALRHAFTTLELHRVEANIMPRNAASLE